MSNIFSLKVSVGPSILKSRDDMMGEAKSTPRSKTRGTSGEYLKVSVSLFIGHAPEVSGAWE